MGRVETKFGGLGKSSYFKENWSFNKYSDKLKRPVGDKKWLYVTAEKMKPKSICLMSLKFELTYGCK